MHFRFFILFFLFTVKVTLSQDNKLQETITDKAVIGFPGVTQAQLGDIKTELLKNSQIQSAYFVFGDHNCLMLVLNTSGATKTFYDLLKPLDNIYHATSLCYIKPYEVYDFIVQKAENTPVFQIKP